LPVVQGKNLVGIITRSDILDFVLDAKSTRKQLPAKASTAKAKKKRR